MQPGGNFEPCDAGYPARGFLSIEFFEDSAAGHGDHHYTGSGFFALSAATGHMQSVVQQEFLESDGFVVAGETKAKCLSTKSADGTGSDFEAPDPIAVQAKLGVKRAVSQTQRSYGTE